MIGTRCKNHLIYFIAGLLSGCIVTFLSTTHGICAVSLYHPMGNEIKLPSADSPSPLDFSEDHHQRAEDDEDQFAPIAAHKHEGDESALTKEMNDNVRIFCWIMTSKNNTRKKAIHVNATWATRCNKHVFMTSEEVDGLPTVDLNVTEGRKFLWMKTKEAFKYIYNNELRNYDWFLKADDDTFVVMENLRFMLLAYSPDDPIYFGCKFKAFIIQGHACSIFSSSSPCLLRSLSCLLHVKRKGVLRLPRMESR
uniref:N-acetylgalactosaminide beta-1,3-galactosyltransferase n=1 Tax=Parascaris univalens TaxID=6257 RepID=A0A915A8J1_PARUN